MSASSSAATVTGGVAVITQVRPTVYSILPQLSETASIDTGENYKARAVPFGMVQNFVGITILSLGILMAQTNSDKLSISTGAFVWGPLTAIIAGFMTSAAGTYLSPPLIKAAVHFSVLAALTSVATTMIFFLDASGVLVSSYPPFGEFDPDREYCTMLSGVSGVLSFLEFGLCSTIAMNNCFASCNLQVPGQSFTITNQLYGTASVSVETPPTNQTPPTAMTPPPPFENPPEYSSIMNGDK